MRQSVRHSNCAFLKHLHIATDLLSSLGTQNKDSFMTKFSPEDLLLYWSAQTKVEKIYLMSHGGQLMRLSCSILFWNKYSHNKQCVEKYGRINPSWKMDWWAIQSFKEKPVLNSVHHLCPVPKLCLWNQQMQIWTPSFLMHLKWNRQKDSEYILIFRTFLQKVRKRSQCPF